MPSLPVGVISGSVLTRRGHLSGDPSPWDYFPVRVINPVACSLPTLCGFPEHFQGRAGRRAFVKRRSYNILLPNDVLRIVFADLGFMDKINAGLVCKTVGPGAEGRYSRYQTLGG
jgi:hypothetical protein